MRVDLVTNLPSLAAVGVLATSWCVACGDGAAGADDVADALGDTASMEDALPDDGLDEGRDIDGSRRDLGSDEATMDWLVLPPTCGDGIIDPGEECDDGNRENGDGCDWSCRSGAGAFEYPLPDDSVPSVVAVGEEREIVPPGAGMGPLAAWLEDELRLAFGWGVFSLAYPVIVPSAETRFQILDVSGSRIGEPWVHAEEWGEAGLHLFRAERDFGLFGSWLSESGVWMARLDVSATEVIPPRVVLEATRDDPFLALLGMAWNGSRYAALLAVGQSEDEFRFVMVGLSPDGEVAATSRPLPRDAFSATGPSSVVGTPGGFVIEDPKRIIAFDDDMNLVGWTGYLSSTDHPPRAGPSRALDTGRGILILWEGWRTSSATPPVDVWAAVADYRGRLIQPPRVVLFDFATADVLVVRAAWSALGAVLVYWTDDPVGDSVPVRAVNLDGWGNPRSTPVDVFSAESPGRLSIGGLAIASDDVGCGVVAQVKRDDEMRLVFRRLLSGATP